MKVVIDTNVLISAILKDRIPEEVILFVLGHPEIDWIVSSDILTEYIGVLARKKFGLSREIQEKWYRIFDENTLLIQDVPSIKFARDQKDAKFLSCAIKDRADFLISGDQDFSEARKILKTTVLTPAEFKKRVMKANE